MLSWTRLVAVLLILYTWSGCLATSDENEGDDDGDDKPRSSTVMSSTTRRYHDDDDDDETAWWGIMIGVLVSAAVLVVVVIAGVCLCKRRKSRVATQVSSTPSVKKFSNCDASPPAYTISDGRRDKATTKEAPPPYKIDIPPPAYCTDQKALPVTPSCPRSTVKPLDDTFKVVPL